MIDISDYVLDNGLQALADQADKIFVTNAQPTTYAEATSGALVIGNKNFGSPGAAFGAIGEGLAGRKVTSVAITDGTVTAAGTISHWAAVDSAASRLLAVGTVNAPFAVAATFQLTPFDIELERSNG